MCGREHSLWIEIGPHAPEEKLNAPQIKTERFNFRGRVHDQRQRRAETLPLMRLDRAPQSNVVMNVLRPLDQQRRHVAPGGVRQSAGGEDKGVLGFQQHPAQFLRDLAQILVPASGETGEPGG